MIPVGRGLSAGEHPQRSMAAAAPISYHGRRHRTGGIRRRTTGDPHGLPPPSELTSPAGITADPISQPDINPKFDPWPYSQRQSRERERIPFQTRMGTKRCREPSPDPPPIPEKWLQLGLRVISLKDSIRQIQRRVILLRLRKASADGILERIVQTLHECVEHAPPPALLRAF